MTQDSVITVLWVVWFAAVVLVGGQVVAGVFRALARGRRRRRDERLDALAREASPVLIGEIEDELRRRAR